MIARPRNYCLFSAPLRPAELPRFFAISSARPHVSALWCAKNAFPIALAFASFFSSRTISALVILRDIEGNIKTITHKNNGKTEEQNDKYCFECE